MVRSANHQTPEMNDGERKEKQFSNQSEKSQKSANMKISLNKHPKCKWS
jgi:hypothetical protein